MPSKANGKHEIILNGVRNARLKKKLGEKCVYCGCNNTLVLNIDHKKPTKRGGLDDDKNKQVTCFTCNYLKGALTDKEFKEYMKALKILKDLNKIKLTFDSQGQPKLSFYEHGHPSTITEMLEIIKKEKEKHEQTTTSEPISEK